MTSKIMEAKLVISGQDSITPVFDKIAAQAKRSADAIKRATEIDGVLKNYTTLTKQIGQAAKESKALNSQIARDAAMMQRAFSLSEPLRKDIAALQLTRKEVALLAREAQRMHDDQQKALAGIGNAKIRAQLVEAERANMEARLRARAQGLAAQRAQEEAFARQLGVLSRQEIAAAAAARKASVEADRRAAAEKMRSAREALRAARDAEREATRLASAEAQERARIARQEARERIAAAREAARGVREHRRQELRYEQQARRQARNYAGMAAGAIGMGGGGYLASRGVRGAVRQGAEGAREAARDYLAGIEGDSGRIQRKALDMSMKYQSVDANTFHERLRDTALAMGSTDKAFEVSDTIGQASVVLQSLKGKDRALEEGRKFFSALDNLGKNQDPAQVRRLMNGWIKALGVEGADLNMSSLLQIARKAKSGGGGLSERFLMGVAPALSMDMGDNELGTAIGTEISQVIGGRATKQSKALQQKYRLRDKKGNFLHRDMIVSDPFEYTEKVLIPALQRQGIDVNNDGAVIEATSKLFSQQTVANLFSKMIGQREQYNRKLKQYDAAPGLEAAEKLAGKDPFVAAAAAMAQTANAAQLLAEHAMPAATQALNLYADAMAGLTAKMAANPETVKAGGAGAGILATIFGPQVAGWMMKKLAGDGTGLMANALRLGGGALSTLGGMLGFGASVGTGTALGLGANESEALNDQGLLNMLRGKESPTARIARELAEERRRAGSGALKLSESTRDAKEKAAEAGKGVGEKAGKGILEGLRETGEEILGLGRKILERLGQEFQPGIMVPIHFVPGQGFGGDGQGGGSYGIQNASFSGAVPGMGGMGGLRTIRPGGRFGGLVTGGGAPPPASAPRGGGRVAALPRSGGSGGGGSFGGRALAVGSGTGVGHVASKEERAAYIRQSAARHGIDPDVALRIAQSEGFNVYTGDQGRSFGDFQLFTGGGLGNKALGEGINVRDPNTWKAQVDFAMREARKSGWKPWYGRLKAGIGVWQGIGKNTGGGASPGMPPPGPGYGVPLHKGGTGMSRYTDEQLLEMEAADLARRKRSIPAPSYNDFGGISPGGVAERMEAAANRIAELSLRTHHTVEVSASPGLQARTRGMHATSRGPIKADVGVSMPRARSEGDWI